MIKGFLRSILLVFIVGFTVSSLLAQPRKSRIQVIVAPTQSGWTYKVGDRADFEVKVLRDGQLVPDASISYIIGPEQMPPEKEGEETLEEGTMTLKGLRFKQPGFVRCEVSAKIDGRTYRGWGTAGFDPTDIQPVTKMPEDFDTFWKDAKAKLAEIPINPELTLIPEYCTATTNVYHLKLQNFATPRWNGRTSHLYGILSVPKKPGKYAALLNVPGAGARPYQADNRATEGFITLSIGIHGIPVNLDNQVYQDLMYGAISDYWIKDLNNKDTYYYKRVYLGCVRAIDYLFSMDEFDGENLAVNGGSQGGALSIVTAGLDSRVKYLAAFYPALCDVTGYLEGRAGGWPHMFKHYDKEANPAWPEVAAYYDVVNFARSVKVPGWYSWGYNDNVCPPTSMYAAYNVIEASKSLHLFLETGHWTFPEQWEEANAWLMEKLRGE